jgi:predicted nucleotide-binding protein
MLSNEDGFRGAMEMSSERRVTKPIDSAKVFVVHGRDEALRRSIFDFLRAVGLKPIEWNQAVILSRNASPYIGDILDMAMRQVQAVVVLLTGDDEARLRGEFVSVDDADYERELTPQPRPNVIFEAGLALGRFPDRTILVQVGKLRPFSDIAGRHSIRFKNTVKARQELAQRLKIAGCPVDLSGTDWHDAGLFGG